jgi:hypothetical protein
MDGEEILNKLNIEKLGFWFWIILFGFFDIIFSIIHDRSQYITLGLYFFTCGGAGYFASTLRQQWSTKKHRKEVDETTTIEKTTEGKTVTEQTVKKKTIIDPPMSYYRFTFAIKFFLFIILCVLVFLKYPEFCPFSI